MISGTLEQVVSQLPHYEEYEGALAAVEAVESTTPSLVDPNSVSNLQAQLKLLEAREALTAPRAWLCVDVAQARQDLPLAYRLGMLAVIDKPMARHHDRNALIRLVTGGIPISNKDVPHEEYCWPPDNPFERAVRISDAILKTASKISSRRETMMARMTVGRMLDNLTRPSEAEYYMVKTAGLVLEEPQVKIHPDELPKVSYALPTIKVAELNYDPINHSFSKKPAGYQDASVNIPQVQQLNGDRHAVAKLFFGEREVKKIAARLQAEHEERQIRTREFRDFLQRVIT